MKFVHDDGGRAFPTAIDKPFGEGRLAVGGMSLRDYFAAAALRALLPLFANGDLQPKDETRKITEDLVAEQAYLFADAMLAERAKPSPRATTE